jgi:hypothetical protein
MAKTSVVTESGEGKGAEKPLRVRVTMDTGIEKILQLDDEGVEIEWAAESIPELEEATVKKLSYLNKQRYFVRMAEAKRAAAKAAVEELSGAGPRMARDPLGELQRKRKKLRARAGWHQTTVRGDQFDAAVTHGMFVQIREKAAGHPEEKPGEETGEVVKIKEGEDRFLIAVECPEEVWQKHLEFGSYESHARYSQDVTESWRAFVEGKNSEIGARKETLVATVDEEEKEEVHRDHWPSDEQEADREAGATG